MLTRAALGAYQKANGLKLDCWPTADVLRRTCRSANENPAALSRRRVGIQIVRSSDQ